MKALKNPFAFTLVELIVVITILAILGTVGFLSLQGYSRTARDSERTSDLATLSKGLDSLVAAGKLLPRPDVNPIALTASGVAVGYQWYAGPSVQSAVSFWGKGKDPLDGQLYTYETNAAQNRYQLLAFYEDSSAVALSPFTEAYAGAYDARTPGSRGAALGVLLGTGANLNQPVQELYSSSTLTGVDLVNTANPYVLWFDRDAKVSGTGVVLKSGLVSTKGLVGYWDMETMNAGKVSDLSGNWNDGTLTGSSLPVAIDGRSGKGLSFNGNWYVSFGDKDAFKLKNAITISVFIRTNANTGFSNLAILGKYGVVNPDDLWYNVNLNVNWRISCGWLGCPGGTGWAPYNGVADNSWHHIVLTDSGNTGTFYLDWVKVLSNSTFPRYAVNDASTTELRVWSVVRWWTNFSGSIDEVRIYNRALSDAEVSVLYNATK